VPPAHAGGTGQVQTVRGGIPQARVGFTAPGDGNSQADQCRKTVIQIEQQLKLYTDALKVQVEDL
jgi:hypothetical protein